MIITKKCKCGGSIYLTEGGVRIEKCDRCSKPYHEPVFGPGPDNYGRGWEYSLSDEFVGNLKECPEFISHLKIIKEKKEMIKK